MIELLEDKACGKYCDLAVQGHGCRGGESLGTSNHLRGTGQGSGLDPSSLELRTARVFLQRPPGEKIVPLSSPPTPCSKCYLLPHQTELQVSSVKRKHASTSEMLAHQRPFFLTCHLVSYQWVQVLGGPSSSGILGTSMVSVSRVFCLPRGSKEAELAEEVGGRQNPAAEVVQHGEEREPSLAVLLFC